MNRDHNHDFDFLFGKWKVRHRKLKEGLKGSNIWDEFASTAVAKPLWNGKANIDEIELGSLQGMTLRLFNPKSQQWSLYWANSDNGFLDPPMIGSFKNGVGEFYDQEVFEGRSIYCRFIWSEITAKSCRWEQAYSEDGGKTWETNWIMEFIRTE